MTWKKDLDLATLGRDPEDGWAIPDEWGVISLVRDGREGTLAVSLDELARVRAVWDNPPLGSFEVVDIYGEPNYIKSKDIFMLYRTTRVYRRHSLLLDLVVRAQEKTTREELDPSSRFKEE